MRAPGYYHLKNKDDPFLVRVAFHSDDKYAEKEMLYIFGQKKPIIHKKYVFDQAINKSEMLDPANWNRIFHLDRLTNGNRNNEFTRISLWLRDTGFPAAAVRETILEMNHRIAAPLPEHEIESILKGKT